MQSNRWVVKHLVHDYTSHYTSCTRLSSIVPPTASLQVVSLDTSDFWSSFWVVIQALDGLCWMVEGHGWGDDFLATARIPKKKTWIFSIFSCSLSCRQLEIMKYRWRCTLACHGSFNRIHSMTGPRTSNHAAGVCPGSKWSAEFMGGNTLAHDIVSTTRRCVLNR